MTPETMEAVTKAQETEKEAMEAVTKGQETEQGGGKWKRRALVTFGVLSLLVLGYSLGAGAQDPNARSEAPPRNDSALRAQLDDARAENDDLSAQVAALEADNAALEDEIAALEDEAAAQPAPAPAQDAGSSLQGAAPQGTKHVEVVVHADTAADYSAYDDKFKVNDSMQVSGDRTFEYDLPAKDGLSVDMMSEDGSYVSVQVYENGKLVAEDEDGSGMGMAYVSY